MSTTDDARADERWFRGIDDENEQAIVPVPSRRVVKVMGPLRCGACGCRLTAGDPRHPDHGPVNGPSVGCTVCARVAETFA